MRFILALIGLLMALPAAGQGLTLTGVGTVAAGAGGGTFATWNTGSPQAVNWDFTLGNTKATCKTTYCSAGQVGAVGSTNPVNPTTDTRKLYWEFTPNYTGTPTNFAVGIVSVEHLAANALAGVGGIDWLSNGDASADGAPPGNLGAWASGTVLAWALDLSTKKIWVRAGCAGLWNASGAANPATGVGGLDVTPGLFWTVPTTAVLAVEDGFNGNANGATLNTGAVAFACVVPSGFVRWQ